MKKKVKTFFTCQSCGFQTPKWMGRCPDCGSWDSFAEEKRIKKDTPKRMSISEGVNGPVPIDTILFESEERIETGLGEFDRVLGGGLV